MRRRFFEVFLLPLPAVMVVVLAFAGCSEKVAVKKEPPVVTIETVTMAEPEIEDRYSAVINPSTQVDVAFRASGYIESIASVRGIDGRMRHIQEGDFVRRGTVLARVRQADYRMRVRQQAASRDEVRLADERGQAELAQAEIGREQARTEFERASRLYTNESLTRPEFEGATAKLAVSEARVREALAQIAANKAAAARTSASLEEAQLALDDCILRAPLDGVVLKRSIEDGSLVSTGTVGFTMADTRMVKVSFGVPDVKLGDLSQGEVVSITTEAVPGKVFRGRITEMSPSADPRSRVFNVAVTIPNDDGRLRAGMVASLETAPQAPEKPLPAVPLASVVRSSSDPTGYSVFVVRVSGGKLTAEERGVKLGEAKGQMVTILSGIAASDKVVTNGSARIVSGQEVRVID